MWDAAELVAAARDTLREESERSIAEQAIHGIDALSEVALHPLLAAGFAARGWGVAREQPYPGEVSRRAKRPQRERCDLVLLPPGCTALADPVVQLLEADKAAATLFAGLAGTAVGAAPGDAFWIEVKAVGQYTYTLGVPGPNRTYAGELTRSLTGDLAKLSRERLLRAGGLLLVLFTADEATAEHDVGVALHRALDRRVEFRTPRVERFALPDRIGNGVCTVALFEVRAPG